MKVYWIGGLFVDHGGSFLDPPGRLLGASCGLGVFGSWRPYSEGCGAPLESLLEMSSVRAGALEVPWRCWRGAPGVPSREASSVTGAAQPARAHVQATMKPHPYDRFACPPRSLCRGVAARKAKF